MNKCSADKKLFFLVFILLFAVAFFRINLYAEQYYWENPERLTTGDCRFPQAVSNENSYAIFWQEIDTKKSEVYLSAAVKKSNSDKLIMNRHFAGPFLYSGEVPDLYSAAINDRGKICVSVLSESNMVSVFSSDDGGLTFARTDFERQNLPVVAPRIYPLKSGEFILFASLGKDESFSMVSSKSRDGINWSNFSIFEPTRNFTNPFLPVLASTEKGDIVFFQAHFNSGTRLSYQLYSTFSKSNGASWTPAELVTDQSSLPQNSNEVYTSYHNQRPSILFKDSKLYIAWERTHYSSENSSIYFAEVDINTGKINSQVERLTSSGNASRPVLFSYKNIISLVWFDTRQGIESVWFSQKEGFLWNEVKLSSSNRAAVFSYPIVANQGRELSFVWQSNNTVYRLSSDTSVQMPQIFPLTYTAGKHSKNKNVRYRIELPEDSSGIAGYSWIWTKDKNENPPHSLMTLPKERFVNVIADEEAEYYFKVCAVDYAGNWSEPQTLSYYRDLTPPPKPKINLPQNDFYGFVNSNSFTLSWNFDEGNPEVTDDVAGYSWNLVRVENLEETFAVSSRHSLKAGEDSLLQKTAYLDEKYSYDTLPSKIAEPGKNVMQQKNDIQFFNYSNGIYVFAVRAIDEVGNAGEPAYAVLYMNKFEPFTQITSIKKDSDIFGNTNLTITGKGFSYDGVISDIYITKEKSSKPEIHLRRADGDFKIVSDSRISDIKLSSRIKEGRYFISLYHTDRGLYKSNIAFSIQDNGTVKIEKEYEYIPDWFGYTKIGIYNVQIAYVLFAFIMLFAFAGLLFSIKGISATVKDFNAVNLQIQALIKGETMPLQKKTRIAALNKKGGGLRLKLILFTVTLVLMVSLLVSVPLGFIMVKTQEHSLSKGLQDRVNVLLESLASGTKAYMPSENVLELSYLPGQSSALDEANYVSITGFKSNENDFANGSLDYVWASNDVHITGEHNLIIDTDSFRPGISRLTDKNILQITENCRLINDEAVKTASETGSNIAKLNAEGALLALNTDSASVERRNEIADITTQLTTRMTAILNDLSIKNSSSYPLYDSTKLSRENTEYLFYRPVLYRSGSSQNYVRAIVFISVSTKSLIEEIDAAQRTILISALAISLFAIAIGTICAVMLASIIVNPIRRLAKHVQMIGETTDKEKLAGKEIIIKSRDEIGQLGDTVNEMTRGLVKAAQDEHLLMDGKVVQQTFLPLHSDKNGNKQTTAELKDNLIECFGYYEGASGVSGDYFDYKKLDDRWYVIIKCDVSGHGVPAALLMTVVATLFRKHFENWSFKKNGTDLPALICTINDFIEGLGIKGKFATIILALVDTQTGDVFLCNAGDNIVHIYDSKEHKQKVLTLAETPAAGPLPTFMVEMKGGFKLEKTHLNKGDVLFLYTDGIEEATRKFRDSNFNVMKCQEPGLEEGAVHKNHKVGQDYEQMEPERVNAIIEAALNRRVYVLEKNHNPNPSERLEFDFTKCDGSVEDAIMALASVEKVFRFYKDPEVTPNDLVRVDKRIDAYLRKCFNMYDFYCSSKQEISEESSYLYYTSLREDEQLDDLTLVAVKQL